MKPLTHSERMYLPHLINIIAMFEGKLKKVPKGSKFWLNYKTVISQKIKQLEELKSKLLLD